MQLRLPLIGFRVALAVDAVKAAIASKPAPAIAPFDAKQARAHQEAWAKHLGVTVEYTNSIGMKFVLIPPGEFMMGSTPAEIEESLMALDQNWPEYLRSEAPQHKTILSQPIYLGVHEVTQKDYAAVMGKNPSHFAPLGAGKDAVAGKDTSNHAVETVFWSNAVEFCATLSRQEKLRPFFWKDGEKVTQQVGTGYRLPTEAEWEFACRAGTTTKYWFGNRDEDMTQVGWIGLHNHAGFRTHAVGELESNPFGLYDMHGNVNEWVQDWWEPTYYEQWQKTPAIDPSGPAAVGSNHVIRGGAWMGHTLQCRASSRYASHIHGASHSIGFRAMLTVEAVKATLAFKPAPAKAPFDAKQARAHQEAWARHLGTTVEYTNTIGMKFVLIPPGEFTMGSTPGEIEEALKIMGEDKFLQESCKSEAPQHQVTLTQPIYLGLHEVTQAEYEKVMGKNPSFFAKTGSEKQWVEIVAGLDTANHPVDGVSWNDAAEFCAKLSEQEKLKPFYFRSGGTVTMLEGTGYRLPTESQWEFACRAGATTRYWIGDKDEDLPPAAWIGMNSRSRTHNVGELKANPFGLYDIHGNVSEWVQDSWELTYYGQFLTTGAIDPNGPSSASSRRVLRGGAWGNLESLCRASFRNTSSTNYRAPYQGLRVLIAVDAVKSRSHSVLR